jgi:hypothetical protein
MEIGYQNVTAWTGDTPYLGRLYIDGNYLRDLPATSLPYAEMTHLERIYIDSNCIDPALQDTDNAERIEDYYGGEWSDSQYLCSEVLYDPAKPSS